MDITGPDRRLAPRIFSGIRAAGMKIKSAEAFRLPEFPGKIHGIIQLDHLDAAGTLSGRTATYIQLNLTLQDGWAPHGAASNLIEELTQNELPGAVIVKAAQDRLSPSTHEPLRDAINAWLTKNQGLLVEGSSGMAGYGEFSHSQNSAFRFGIGFGYGSTAQVNQYK
jgi:hypothetical protein